MIVHDVYVMFKGGDSSETLSSPKYEGIAFQESTDTTPFIGAVIPYITPMSRG